MELKKKRRKATKKSEIKDFVGYVDNLENIYDLSFTEQVKLLYSTKSFFSYVAAVRENISTKGEVLMQFLTINAVYLPTLQLHLMPKSPCVNFKLI